MLKIEKCAFLDIDWRKWAFLYFQSFLRRVEKIFFSSVTGNNLSNIFQEALKYRERDCKFDEKVRVLISEMKNFAKNRTDSVSTTEITDKCMMDYLSAKNDVR